MGRVTTKIMQLELPMVTAQIEHLLHDINML
jgi:hypothetical protein